MHRSDWNWKLSWEGADCCSLHWLSLIVPLLTAVHFACPVQLYEAQETLHVVGNECRMCLDGQRLSIV